MWHALDDSTQTVVTLEILRDRSNDAARQRFLAEARRMAAIERPSVMRVASIVDGGTDTFIVFEHLIPLPVVLTGLTAVARDVRPATKAAQDNDKTVVLTQPRRRHRCDRVVDARCRRGTHARGWRDDLAAAETAPHDRRARRRARAIGAALVVATTRLPETVRDAHARSCRRGRTCRASLRS